MHIQMIGHSTMIFEQNGCKIITDPYFGTMGNPIFQRVVGPYKGREEWVDKVNMVLVSHSHWDHIDRKFFNLLPRSIPVLMPKPMTLYSKLLGIKNSVGLEMHEKVEYGQFEITCVPAKHPGHACGYVIETYGHTAYFSGDTYYSDFMTELGNTYKIDTAFMPVSTSNPPMTMDHASAVEAVEALRPKVVVPIHTALRPRASFMRTEETPEAFEEHLKSKGFVTKVVIMKEGETCKF